MILFPHSVYIGFRLFVLLGGRSSDVCSMPWGVRGSLVSWADCSALPRPAVRPDPTRPLYVRVLDSTGYRPVPIRSSCSPTRFKLHFPVPVLPWSSSVQRGSKMRGIQDCRLRCFGSPCLGFGSGRSKFKFHSRAPTG